MIETVVKAFPCFSRKKKNVNKHKKNVISFIADIFHIVALLSGFKCFFGKTLHDKVLGSIVFQAFSNYSNKWFDFFHSYLQIKWNPVKPDVLPCRKNCLWLMIGWKPYLRKLPVADVWLDLGLTQTCQDYKKMCFREISLLTTWRSSTRGFK